MGSCFSYLSRVGHLVWPLVVKYLGNCLDGWGNKYSSFLVASSCSALCRVWCCGSVCVWWMALCDMIL